MNHPVVPSRIEDVVLDPVSAEGWRVRNSTRSSDDPFALLGFVTRLGDGYLAHRMGVPGHDIHSGSLDEARRVYVGTRRS